MLSYVADLSIQATGDLLFVSSFPCRGAAHILPWASWAYSDLEVTQWQPGHWPCVFPHVLVHHRVQPNGSKHFEVAFFRDCTGTDVSQVALQNQAEVTSVIYGLCSGLKGCHIRNPHLIVCDLPSGQPTRSESQMESAV